MVGLRGVFFDRSPKEHSLKRSQKENTKGKVRKKPKVVPPCLNSRWHGTPLLKKSLARLTNRSAPLASASTVLTAG
jgi:hypothetical protein